MRKFGESYSRISEQMFKIAWLEDWLDRRKTYLSEMQKRLGIGLRFENRRFDTFEKGIQEKAFEKCRQYAEEFESRKKENVNSLLLLGTCGTGKTHLAAAIANYVFEEYGEATYFNTFAEIIEILKQNFQKASEINFNFIKSVSLLILDDIGAENQTAWSNTMLYLIINYRYEHRLPTIITTNFSKNDIEHYLGKACFSRVSESFRAIEMIGEDYRKRI